MLLITNKNNDAWMDWGSLQYMLFSTAFCSYFELCNNSTYNFTAKCSYTLKRQSHSDSLYSTIVKKQKQKPLITNYKHRNTFQHFHFTDSLFNQGTFHPLRTNIVRWIHWQWLHSEKQHTDSAQTGGDWPLMLVSALPVKCQKCLFVATHNAVQKSHSFRQQ